ECPRLEASAHAAIAVAVAGLVADIRMNLPAAQQGFADEANFFHDASGADVLDIAHGANAEDPRLSQRPIRDITQCLGDQASAPAEPRQHTPNLQAVRFIEPQVDGAADRLRLADDI